MKFKNESNDDAPKMRFLSSYRTTFIHKGI